MAKEGELPPVWADLNIDLVLLDAMVSSSGEAPERVRPLQSGEMLMLNSATATSVGTVSQIKGKNAKLKLRLPICAEVGSRITLSRRIGSRWRLIGHAAIKE
jgi:translation initiation factor 2 subunit 3